MKSTIKLIFETEGLSTTYAGYNSPARKIEITVDAVELTLPELLEQLDVFVKSCGYFPPQNCILDYVNNDDFVAHDESEDESATWPEEEKECQETDSSVTEPSI
jgi:hypothetical protein